MSQRKKIWKGSLNFTNQVNLPSESINQSIKYSIQSAMTRVPQRNIKDPRKFSHGSWLDSIEKIMPYIPDSSASCVKRNEKNLEARVWESLAAQGRYCVSALANQAIKRRSKHLRWSRVCKGWRKCGVRCVALIFCPVRQMEMYLKGKKKTTVITQQKHEFSKICCGATFRMNSSVAYF